ncbi:MAG: amidase family protein, partial [Micromonosporaceae bacterium]
QSLGLSTAATWFACADMDAAAFELAELQPRTRRHAMIGHRLRRWSREVDRQRWRDRILTWFEAGSHDLLVMPVLAASPLRAAAWSRKSWLANTISSMRFAPFAAPWNVAGLPAISVPSGVRRDGLPGAVQLVGPPGSEELLLATAAQIEAAAPWRQQAPGWPRLGKAASL